MFLNAIVICNRMPYIDLHEHVEGLVMLETVEKNVEMFTERERDQEGTASACSTAPISAPHGQTHEANCKSAKSKEHSHQNF